ncbi:MAG TPA: ABC transporter ATP-binding protein [Anaerolineae bacterium]|nr:ABC transporter ATP-binding protein [Anaerolineae bacterium]
MLEVHEIYKEYEDKPLLQGVSFRVRKKEVVCLLGPSGSGKTTLLKIIAGLEGPEDGQIRWGGKDLVDIPAHRRRFGLMFQDYALFPHLTVFENVAFGLRMQGWTKERIDNRVEQVLKMVRMFDFIKRGITDLSGGEQQRVALARTIAPDPKLLMLDEPLGALDRSLRDQLMDELRSLLRSFSIPTIYVTHDQEEAFAIADRVIVLHGGIVEQDESAVALYKNPVNLWVASFLGFDNQVAGRVILEHPLRIRTELGEFRVDCRNVTDLHLDESVVLVFRPEGIEYKGESVEKNQFYGAVEDILFRGGRFIIKLRCNKKMVFSFYSKRALNIGEKMNFYIYPKDIMCFKVQ